MSTELMKKQDDDSMLRLAMAIVFPPKKSDEEVEEESKAGRLEQAAETLGLSTLEVAEMINDATFLKVVRGLTKAKAIMALHGPGIERLSQMIETGANKDAIAAFKALGIITGDMTQKVDVEVKHTFETLRKQKPGLRPDDPLAQIFDIKEFKDVTPREQHNVNVDQEAPDGSR